MKATGGAFCALKGDGTVVSWGTLAFQEIGSWGLGRVKQAVSKWIFSPISSHHGREEMEVVFLTFFRVYMIFVLWNCNEKPTKKALK